MKALNEYCLEMDCRRSARRPKLAPMLRVTLNLHGILGAGGFEACAVRRMALLLHGKV